MKSKYATEDFPWTSNEDETEFICVIGDYMLRVDQFGLDVCEWDWNVIYKGESIYSVCSEMTKSINRALGLAEGVYMGHSIKQNL